MKKLFVNILLCLVPLFLILALYICFDPFKVIFSYENYYISDAHNSTGVDLDKDYTSTQNLINNLSKYNYDSFIFGSSRSMYYSADEWGNYIHSQNTYHFDAFGESILGIYRRVMFLNKQNVKIKHALFVLDYATLKIMDENNFHSPMHPILSGHSWMWFELEHFKKFLNAEFFWAYFDFKLNHKIRSYMRKDGLLGDSKIRYNKKTNELRFYEMDELIEKHPEQYYTKERLAVFYKRDSVLNLNNRIIDHSRAKLLGEIVDYLKYNNAEYKVIISPLYDQRKFHPKDLIVLDSIFGQSNVFDFSGINKFTNDFHNYYEQNHYRPTVASEILKEIYMPTYQ